MSRLAASRHSRTEHSPWIWTLDFIDRFPLLATLNYCKAQALCRTGIRRHGSGTTAQQLGVAASVEYARDVALDYIRYGADGDFSRLRDKHVLEIGPGDNLSVAVMLLAWGAAS